MPFRTSVLNPIFHTTQTTLTNRCSTCGCVTLTTSVSFQNNSIVKIAQYNHNVLIDKICKINGTQLHRTTYLMLKSDRKFIVISNFFIFIISKKFSFPMILTLSHSIHYALSIYICSIRSE